jgi:hypothetical protein
MKNLNGSIIRISNIYKRFKSDEIKEWIVDQEEGFIHRIYQRRKDRIYRISFRL